MERAKNLLRALAFNLIDLDNNQIFKNKKKINIKSLHKDFVLLKPDKGNGIVLIKALEYYSSLDKLFSDKSKFKQIVEDPTANSRHHWNYILLSWKILIWTVKSIDTKWILT